MRFATTLKTLIRSPLKSLLTLLLLTATTFAFVSRGVEYVATVQQIRAAEASYFATGTVEMTLSAYEDAMYQRLGEEAYTLEGGNYLGRTSRAILPMDATVADTVLSSEYVEKAEVRLVSGGTHRDYWSVLEQPLSDLRDYNEWWDRFAQTDVFSMYDAVYVLYTDTVYDHNGLHGSVAEVLLAYPKTISAVRDLTASYVTRDYANFFDHYSNWYNMSRENDAKAECIAYWDIIRETAEFGDFFLIFGAPGSNGLVNVLHQRNTIFVVEYPIINLSRIEREYGETDIFTILSDPEAYGCLPYRSSSRNELIPNLEYAERIYRNLHTSEVVYTSDMDLIHKYKTGDLYISDGRALTENEQSEVCVIGADFAELNGLSVGDSITLDLCADTMIHSGKVFGRETPYPTDRDVVSENQLTERGLENVEKTFEIVGIWSDAAFDVEDPYTYALNTIFVPESCYPWAGQVEPSLLPSTFSFELKHPGDAALIKAELGDQLAALGYELKINDGGYAAAKPNLDFMRLSALIGFVAMCVGLLLCLVLITYLFIIRKKKDYAIMRALGTTKSRSNRSLLSALLTLALIAVTIGAFIAGFAAQTAAVKAAAEVAELTGVESTGVGSWEFTIAFAVGTLGLVFTFARAGLIKISRTPPLALLQGR